MSDVRAATTILLVRDGDSGPEVFMVQRHRRSGFLPNAWVFPGGRVDPTDKLAGNPAITGVSGLARGFELPEDAAVAHGVAGVRETFEEAGVWLGDGALPAQLRNALNAGNVLLADVLAKHNATIPLDRMRAWSWWVTPKAEPRRYDTRFLIAAAPEGDARHDEVETVDSRWVSARSVLETPDHEGFPLAPPTWWTLRELAAYPNAAAAMTATRPAGRPIQPIMEFEDTGIKLLLPGHPGHPEPALDGLADTITFDGNWVAWRNEQRLPAY